MIERQFSDKDVFTAFVDGEEEAFEIIFKRYYPRLRHFAAKYIADEASANDAVQTCFMRLWERRATLANVSVQSMLYTMLRNECINNLKHHAIVEGYAQKTLSATTTETLYNVDFLGDSDHKLLYDELKENIETALNMLPLRTADIFRMSRYDGLKNREIAQQLGISTTAVEKHISKALKTIASLLADKYGTGALYVMMQIIQMQSWV